MIVYVGSAQEAVKRAVFNLDPKPPRRLNNAARTGK
jgi:hypothetical protein